MRKARPAFFLALALALLSIGLPIAAPAATNALAFSLTASGQTAPIDCSANSIGYIQFTSGTGSIVPQGSQDNGTTWATITAIANGSIAGAGNYFGMVAGYPLFRANVTVSAGTVSGIVGCTQQIGPGTVVGNIPSGPFSILSTADLCQTNPSIFSSVSALAVGTTTQVIALASGKNIIICDITGAFTGTTYTQLSVIQGTGANCVTSPVTIGAYGFKAAATASTQGTIDEIGSPGPLTATTITGQAICLNLGAATNTANAYTIRYVQQ